MAGDLRKFLKTTMKLTGHTQVQTLMKHYANVVDGAEEEALKGLFGDS